ncbi:MAG TPA: biopolymer transporter ExbD [Vicinamibacterales bacterium]|nr:biopolymer transporter ExbD [Vicinamibacterales bacterium]
MPKVQQNGSGGGGRRARGAHVATSLAEINVVPLVDVMLVLLIIFMVTAPMMQQGLEVNLPQTRKANPVNAEPVYVTIPADFAKHRIVQVGDKDVRVEILHELVRQALLNRTDKSVFVRADARATVQDFMTVTDKLNEAGVDKIGMLSQPAQRR